MGGEGEDSQGPVGVPPPGGATYHRDDSETRGRNRVVVTPSGGGNVSCGAPPHQGVNQKASDNHRGEGGLPPRLCTVHGGGADAGDEPDGALVGSRRGK